MLRLDDATRAALAQSRTHHVAQQRALLDTLLQAEPELRVDLSQHAQDTLCAADVSLVPAAVEQAAAARQTARSARVAATNVSLTDVERSALRDAVHARLVQVAAVLRTREGLAELEPAPLPVGTSTGARGVAHELDALLQEAARDARILKTHGRHGADSARWLVRELMPFLDGNDAARVDARYAAHANRDYEAVPHNDVLRAHQFVRAQQHADALLELTVAKSSGPALWGWARRVLGS